MRNFDHITHPHLREHFERIQDPMWPLREEEAMRENARLANEHYARERAKGKPKWYPTKVEKPSTDKIWADSEIHLLTECWQGRMDFVLLTKTIRRTKASCRAKAQELGLTERSGGEPAVKEELPRRYPRVRRGKEYAWSKEHLAALKTCWENAESVRQLAIKLGCSENHCRRTAQKMGLKRASRIYSSEPLPWSKDSLDALHACWAGQSTLRTLAMNVGKRKATCCEKAQELGLVWQSRVYGGRSPWSEADDTVLRKGRATGKTAQTIADSLGRTLSATNQRAYEIGLTGARRAKK